MSSESAGTARLSWHEPEVIRRLVTGARTIAVVGASPGPARPSHGVARYLHAAGLRIFPVNPSIDTLFGLRAYPSLSDVPEPIDIVDVFRRPEHATGIAREAVRIKAGALWLQLGVVSEQAARIAAEGGLGVVMDRCLAIEHRRLA